MSHVPLIGKGPTRDEQIKIGVVQLRVAIARETYGVFLNTEFQQKMRDAADRRFTLDQEIEGFQVNIEGAAEMAVKAADSLLVALGLVEVKDGKLEVRGE